MLLQQTLKEKLSFEDLILTSLWNYQIRQLFTQIYLLDQSNISRLTHVVPRYLKGKTHARPSTVPQAFVELSETKKKSFNSTTELLGLAAIYFPLLGRFSWQNVKKEPNSHLSLHHQHWSDHRLGSKSCPWSRQTGQYKIYL